MKIKDGFELRNVCGENVVFSTSLSNVDYTKLSVLNGESSVFLFNLLMKYDMSEEELADALCREFEVEKATALADVKNFCKQLKDAEVAE